MSAKLWIKEPNFAIAKLQSSDKFLIIRLISVFIDKNILSKIFNNAKIINILDNFADFATCKVWCFCLFISQQISTLTFLYLKNSTKNIKNTPKKWQNSLKNHVV